MKLELVVFEKHSRLTIRAESDFEKKAMTLLRDQGPLSTCVQIDYHGHETNNRITGARIEVDFMNDTPGKIEDGSYVVPPTAVKAEEVF